MDMDDLSAEKWAEQIKAVCPVDITEQLAAYRKAVVEACRKAVCKDCHDGIQAINGDYACSIEGKMYQASGVHHIHTTAFERFGVPCRAQAIAGVGKEK